MANQENEESRMDSERKDLQKIVLRLNRVNILISYAFGLLLICAGFYLLYLLIFTNWYFETNQKNGGENLPLWFVYPFFSSLPIAGTLMLIITKRDFTLKMIKSNLDINKKCELLDYVFGEHDLSKPVNQNVPKFVNKDLIFQDYHQRNLPNLTSHHYGVFVTKEAIYLYAITTGIMGYGPGKKCQKRLKKIISELNEKLAITY